MTQHLAPERLLHALTSAHRELGGVPGNGIPGGGAVHEVVPSWLSPLRPGEVEDSWGETGRVDPVPELRERGFRDWVAPSLEQDDGLFDVIFDLDVDEEPVAPWRREPSRSRTSRRDVAPQAAMAPPVEASSPSCGAFPGGSRAARRHHMRVMVKALSSSASLRMSTAG